MYAAHLKVKKTAADRQRKQNTQERKARVQAACDIAAREKFPNNSHKWPGCPQNADCPLYNTVWNQVKGKRVNFPNEKWLLVIARETASKLWREKDGMASLLFKNSLHLRDDDDDIEEEFTKGACGDCSEKPIVLSEDERREDKEESEEPSCSICLCTEIELPPPQVLTSILGEESGCPHFWCTSCCKQSFTNFARDPSASALECTLCKKDSVVLRRPAFMPNAKTMYYVDPQDIVNTTWHFGLSDSDVDNMTHCEAKQAYFGVFGDRILTCNQSFARSMMACGVSDAVLKRCTGGLDQWRLTSSCRWCTGRDGVARGPISPEGLSLVRCQNPRCLRVTCVACGAPHAHAWTDCPRVKEEQRKHAEASAAAFDRKEGRACPYLGCGLRKYVHEYRSSCHMVVCPDCSRVYCYVCGMPKQGCEHDAFDGRCCRCPVMCGAPGECPCFVPGIDDK